MIGRSNFDVSVPIIPEIKGQWLKLFIPLSLFVRWSSDEKNAPDSYKERCKLPMTPIQKELYVTLVSFCVLLKKGIGCQPLSRSELTFNVSCSALSPVWLRHAVLPTVNKLTELFCTFGFSSPLVSFEIKKNLF